MACSAARVSLLRNSSVRHFAAAAAPQPAASANVDHKVLGNKVTVATVENNSPVSQVSIVFRAGSRNETYHTQGTTHYLRIAAGLTTSRATTFGITRNIQQLGGNLLATADRETISYTLQVTRDNLVDALKFLEDVATHQVFKPWEITDQEPRIRYELSGVSEFTQVIEHLHKAAYRSGLGYSLYARKQQLGKLGPETLKHFVNTWCTGPRCAVVATGAPFGEISAFASNLDVGTGEGTNQVSKYYGGEVRKDRNSHLATIAVAVEGAGLDKKKDALALAVLQKAAGTGPHVKWGSSASPLYRTLSSAAGTDPFAISALNASYTDSGLFGFVLSAPAHAAGTLTKTAYKWLRSPNLTDADIARGKTELKASVLYAADNSAALLENLANQAALTGNVSTPASIAAEIDNVSSSDVQSVASRLGNGKTSMAAIGDLSSVPYIDQLS